MAIDERVVSMRGAMQRFRAALQVAQQDTDAPVGTFPKPSADGLEQLGRNVRNLSMDEMFYMGDSPVEHQRIIQKKLQLRQTAERTDDMLRAASADIFRLLQPHEVAAIRAQSKDIPGQDFWTIWACRLVVRPQTEARILPWALFDSSPAGDWANLARSIGNAKHLFVDHFEYNDVNAFSVDNSEGLTTPDFGR